MDSHIITELLKFGALIIGVVIWARGGFSWISVEEKSTTDTLFREESEYNDPVHDLVRDPNKFDSTPYYDEFRNR